MIEKKEEEEELPEKMTPFFSGGRKRVVRN